MINFFKSPLMVLSTTILFLPTAQLTTAGTDDYVPPKREPIGRTEGGGSRGDCSDEIAPISLQLLSPRDHTPTTTSGHPTFFWYVSQVTANPMRFTLVEPQVVKPIYKKWIKVSKPGIIKLEIPHELQELELGKKYRWTVSILCNEDRPSENIYAQAWVERIPIDSNLAKKLVVETDELARAEIYAQFGIWYDALTSAYESLAYSPSQQPAKSYFNQLLARVGISDVIIPDEQLGARRN